MAREKGGPRYVWGICTNLDKDGNGNPCPNCKTKERLKLSIRSEFVCPECGETLTKVEGPKGINLKLICIVVIVLLLLAGTGFGIYKLLSSPKRLTGIKLEKKELVMKVGETQTIVPTAEPEGMNVTFIFKKKGKNVEVTRGGEVTALKKGEAKILVKCEENPDIRAICSVTVIEDTVVVTPPMKDSVYIAQLSIKNTKDFTLVPGATKMLEYLAEPESNDETPLWESSNPSVAIVSETGEVRAVGAGSTTITIRSSRTSASVKVTVQKIEGEEPRKLNLGYGIYEGPMKSGKANGIGGTIRFVRTYTIDLKKASGESVDVYPGDMMINVKMENNHLIQGLLKRSDGSQRWIIIG